VSNFRNYFRIILTLWTFGIGLLNIASRKYAKSTHPAVTNLSRVVDRA